MPVVEYSKDDDELLDETVKKYHREIADETDAYSVIVTVPSTCNTSVFLCQLVEIFFKLFVIPLCFCNRMAAILHLY